MTDTVALLLALLTVFAQAGFIVVAVLFVFSRISTRARTAWVAVVQSITPVGLWMAWTVTIAATAGSLYFSEVAGYRPCELCWYQRIALYPLTAVLGIAAFRRDARIAIYAAPLAVAGALIAAYHYQLQRFPSQASEFCDPQNPCTLTWVWELNYISIPMMALTAGVLIASLVTLVYMEARPPGSEGTTNANTG